MLTPIEIRARHREVAAAALAQDATGLATAQGWLEAMSGRDLLRLDGMARQFWYADQTLGKPIE